MSGSKGLTGFSRRRFLYLTGSLRLDFVKLTGHALNGIFARCATRALEAGGSRGRGQLGRPIFGPGSPKVGRTLVSTERQGANLGHRAWPKRRLE